MSADKIKLHTYVGDLRDPGAWQQQHRLATGSAVFYIAY